MGTDQSACNFCFFCSLRMYLCMSQTYAQLPVFAWICFAFQVFLMYSMILLGYQCKCSCLCSCCSTGSFNGGHGWVTTAWLAVSSMTGYECIRGPDKLW